MILASLASLQFLLLSVLALGIFAFSLAALLHCATTPAQAFLSEGKRTKNFWLAVTGLGTLLAFLALPPAQFISGFMALFILVIPGVYFADVRPAVKYHRRKKNGGGGGSMGSGQWGQSRW
ncbi:MAG: DUF2516 family protein [Actinomycetaceae bacterium]|nr:DUF2516 family protein [Actinomycetaceae bacterium]